MTRPPFDLRAAAHQEMLAEGFQPDFPPQVVQQVKALEARTEPSTAEGVRDLTSLLWSSIDNDTSRDLDQAEAAERVSGGIRVLDRDCGRGYRRARSILPSTSMPHMKRPRYTPASKPFPCCRNNFRRT